jgi:hypothetical protein
MTGKGTAWEVKFERLVIEDKVVPFRHQSPPEVDKTEVFHMGQ